MAEYVIKEETLANIADVVRAKTGLSGALKIGDINTDNKEIMDNTKMPDLNNPASAAHVLSGYEIIDENGEVIIGEIVTKTADNLIANGASITVPSGYYADSAIKSIATAAQAAPSITVDTTGKITAAVTQSAGYVNAGTTSTTYQLAFQPATTITPGAMSQIAVPSGYYTGGSITVAAIPENYIDKESTEDKVINKTFFSGNYVNNRMTQIPKYAFCDGR